MLDMTDNTIEISEYKTTFTPNVCPSENHMNGVLSNFWSKDFLRGKMGSCWAGENAFALRMMNRQRTRIDGNQAIEANI